jgi:polysaccharide deacetylase 2 family uncharacterized protein YibQ
MIKKLPLKKGQEPWPAFYLITAIMIGVALVSVVTLDFINFRKGERSYLFAHREKKPAPIPVPVPEVKPPVEKSLAQVLEDSLAAAGIARDSITSAMGPEGEPLVGVSLPAKLYESIEKAIEDELRRQETRVLEKKKDAQESRTEYQWQVARGEKERAQILFVCPVEPAPRREVARKEPPPKKKIRGQVALIVDDMGNSLEALNDLLSLKQSITVSILPYSAYALETARIAHENNLEILLHLPLESLNNHDMATDTEGMITAGMSPGEIAQSFEASLVRVPFADGVNNHMGSKFTADASLMRALLTPLKEKGLLFVDSRTTAQTVAYDEALRMGIPAVERNVFLDADADRSRIKSRLIELFKTAQKKGRALGICHPYPETLEALKANFSLFEDYGLEVVPVSRLVSR